MNTMKTALILLPISILMVAGQPPRPVYGPPTGGGDLSTRTGGTNTAGGDEDNNSEPANYQFSYEVKDDKANLDFGHMEGRQGDLATGSYHVLLPDGRTQKVEYTADQGGYMPKVSYEGEINPNSYGPPGGSTSSRGSTNEGIGIDGGGGYRY